MRSPNVLDDVRLEQIADALEAIGRKTGFERRTQMGQIIVEQVFSGDVSDCANESSPSQLSFRRLAALLDGRISKSELHRSLHVYLLCRELPFVPTSGHLTVSHADAVLGLPREAREQLLRTALEHRLTVRQLRQLRRNAERRAPGADPRQQLASLARRAYRRGRRTSEALELFLRNVHGERAGLPRAELAHLMRCVESLESTCAEVRRSLESRCQDESAGRQPLSALDA